MAKKNYQPGWEHGPVKAGNSPAPKGNTAKSFEPDPTMRQADVGDTGGVLGASGSFIGRLIGGRPGMAEKPSRGLGAASSDNGFPGPTGGMTTKGGIKGKTGPKGTF